MSPLSELKRIFKNIWSDDFFLQMGKFRSSEVKTLAQCHWTCEKQNWKQNSNILVYSVFLNHHLDGHSSYLPPGTSSRSGRNNHNSLTYGENLRCFMTYERGEAARFTEPPPFNPICKSTTSNVWLNKTRCFHMTRFIWICLCTVNNHGLEIIPKQVFRCVYHITAFPKGWHPL